MFNAMFTERSLMCLQSVALHQVCIKKPSVVQYISNLKLLKNLRVQTLGQIHGLTLMVICANGLPELKSSECTNPEYESGAIFT
ncbi:unnamed protein product [Rotaria socialis]|uniref:Uncharacterized protein n=2 Tax=Rotaria socialis TaxID=392032 RepID=A0A820QWJ0_9BILA|nr:unnamed protein product [Rotaria socialis]CAF3335404.1 unnamed protein product [Rotaria socialis]CAF4125228.1 unnamed protein product [Rotaria socialis]CAF4427604.1 unnamed protein product [Rotaria socialis]CAF4699979.1 unnamed protein product [Rotaria socialis]